MTDVGLGLEEGASTFPTTTGALKWGLAVSWDIDANAAALDGDMHGWLSDGHHGGGGGSHLGHVGDERGSGWWLGHISCHWHRHRPNLDLGVETRHAWSGFIVMTRVN